VVTDEELGALATIYRAEDEEVVAVWPPSPSVRTTTENKWDDLVVVWRALAARGLVMESDGPEGPGFDLTADGRAAVVRTIGACACWCHRPQVEAYRASHSCCAAIYAERPTRRTS